MFQSCEKFDFLGSSISRNTFIVKMSNANKMKASKVFGFKLTGKIVKNKALKIVSI